MTLDSDSNFIRNLSSSTNATGSAYTVTNTASSGTVRVVGENINLEGTDNASGTNILTGLNFTDATTHTNNYYNALVFGSGYTNYISSPTINISGSGAITGATGFLQQHLQRQALLPSIT